MSAGRPWPHLKRHWRLAHDREFVVIDLTDVQLGGERHSDEWPLVMSSPHRFGRRRFRNIQAAPPPSIPGAVRQAGLGPLV